MVISKTGKNPPRNINTLVGIQTCKARFRSVYRRVKPASERKQNTTLVSMEPKKRFPGLIEHNKDSPFQILDVRSINQNPGKFDRAEDAADASDESSGSEKELVIDMADAETEESQNTADESNQPVKPEVGTELVLPIASPSPSPSPPPQAPPEPAVKSPPKNRINRRKSRHVPMEDPDASFRAPVLNARPVPPVRPPPVPEPSSDLQESIHANRNIMKHIALLRTTINYLVNKKHNRTIKFPVVTSDLSTMDSWMQKYEQIKRQQQSVGESSHAKISKKK